MKDRSRRMARRLAGVNVALLALCLAYAFVSYAEEPLSNTDLVLAHVAEDYPAWNISYLDTYGSGMWQGQRAQHVHVGLYRVEEDLLIQKELHVLVNPILAGESISYDETDLVPLPLSPEAARRIGTMTREEAARTLYHWIDTAEIPECALFMLEDGDAWEDLRAFSDKIIGVAADREGRQSFRIAYWNGQAFDRIVSSPAQEEFFYFNDIHSNSKELELMLDHGLVYIYCVGDEPGIGGINTGWSIWIFDNGLTWEASMGISEQNSNEMYPGAPLFPLALTDLDLSAVPTKNAKLLDALDADGWACVKVNGAPMLDAPEGNVTATCYARLYGRVIEKRDDKVLLLIGSKEHGVTGWFRREDLAFGREGFFIPCGFPSYAWEDRDTGHLNERLIGLPAPLSDETSHRAWLIGMTANGGWLVLVDMDIVCTAPPDAFTWISEPEEYDDPRYHYGWDENGLRTLEYTEDETGLISLKVITEDAEFTLESFPPDCCLITDEVPGILLRYYYPLPAEAADWDEILQNDTVLLTFDCLNGQWVLTECTDDLTWTAEAKDGRVTFSDYKQPGPEWEWSAELDGDLMTFGFSALDALIIRYNTLMPERPSVTEP